MLTLVPAWRRPETYARELCSALARVGSLEYRVFLPAIARDAADGLESSVVGQYRASRTMPGRIEAMSLCRGAPWTASASLERLDRLRAIHFPLSVMLPTVEHPSGRDLRPRPGSTRRTLSSSAREFAYRKVMYGRTIRQSRIVITISEHARLTLLERYATRTPIAREQFTSEAPPRCLPAK